jgi:ABC-type branched-subunit amino acid transport system ATPase component/MFS family permease
MTAPLDRDYLDHAARVALGVTGRQQVARYSRAAGDRGRSRVTSLARLAFADALPTVLVVLLVATMAPDLSTTESTLRALIVAGALVTVLASFLTLALAGGGRRLKVAVIVGTNAGLVAVVVAQLSTLWAVAAVLAVRAALLGAGVVVQRPLLVDVAPPEARVRALARWRAGAVVGASAAAGLAALAVGGPEWGWRGMLALAGGVAAVLGLAVAFVDDPGLGGFERSRMVKLVGPDAAPSDRLGGVGLSLDRAARTAAVRISLTGYVGVGFAVAAPIAASLAWVRALGFTLPAAFGGLAAAWLGAAVATVVASDGLEARRRRSPGSLAAAAPVLLGVAAVGLLTLGLSPNAIGALVGVAVAAAGGVLAASVLDATALSAVEAMDRPAVAALTSLSTVGGAVLGLVWVEVASNRYDTGVALWSLALPVGLCALASLRLSRAADRALVDVVETIALRAELAPPAATAAVPRWARSVDTSALWRPALPQALLPPTGYAPSPSASVPAPSPVVAAEASAAHHLRTPVAPPPPAALGAPAGVDPLDPKVPLADLVAGHDVVAGEVVPPVVQPVDSQVHLVARLISDPDHTDDWEADGEGQTTDAVDGSHHPAHNGSAHGAADAAVALGRVNGVGHNGVGASRSTPYVDLLPGGPGSDGHLDPLTAPLEQLGSYEVGTVWEYSLPGPGQLDEPAQGPAVLEARTLNFSYGSVQVLFDVDLRVEEGELVALLGPNGVGKTTLLRALSGLARPSSGQVLLGGEDVTRLGAARRVPLGLSEIVGGQAVFGSMTVAENLRMYGFTLGRDKSSVEAGTEAAFEVFPRLSERRNQLASTLSGGEQQMLGLSKALMLKPKVLLVDEFSLGLAPVVVGELMALVRRLNAEGTAILLVEQSVNVALALARRVYFMEKGRVVYEGLAEELRQRPDLVAELTLGGHADRLAEAPA